MLDTVERLDASLTEASYTVRETRRLTDVSEASIRHWLSGYPDSAYQLKSTWEDEIHPDPLLVSFVELIEILVVGNIRAATGEKFAFIREYHDAIAAEWGTFFPFAHQNLLELSAQGGKLPKPLGKTLQQMDYQQSHVVCWYPMGKDQPIAVDPHRGSGAPTIKGRRLRVQDIRGYFVGGDSVSFLAASFELEHLEIEAALRFALLTAK